ncbi:MAG: 3,6-diketocamphane 1,6-monooxygenase [Chloroflexi bacterium]|nr:3,6-diketocamphane 1,6-monooxygenase [Chloroflexota bacterium]
MEFGLFSHDERNFKVAADAWDEDLYEIVAGDRLGFSEAWITEHSTGPRPGIQPCADLFIIKAATLTKQIRLGPGIHALPMFHPIQVATQIAVCDHLTRGRYMAGFGAGGEQGNTSGRLGLGDVSERYERLYEGLDLVLQCLTEKEPFDFDGQFWRCTDVQINPKPYQQPRMPIGLACSRKGKTLAVAAEKGLFPLISFFDPPARLKEMAEVFTDAAQAVGRGPCRSEIRIPRYIHVSEKRTGGRDEVREALTSQLERRKRSMGWQFKQLVPEDGSLADVTFDAMVDAGSIIVGDPDMVYERIKDTYDEVGGFGVLLLMVGRDIGSRRQRVRSMKLFMEEVAPRLASLNPDRERIPAMSS